MDRYTKRDARTGRAYLDEKGAWLTPDGTIQGCAIEDLAAYEDIGLTPEEIKLLRDGLDEYRKAEAEGRLIKLPCDANVTLRYKGLEYKADHWNPPYLTAFADDLTVPSKKRLHLFTPEAAEAALKEAQQG